MANPTYDERVDDSILIGALRLSRQRDRTVRQMIEAHRMQCETNWRDSHGTDMESYWRHRIDRCNVLIQDPNDNMLRRRAVGALDRE